MRVPLALGAQNFPEFAVDHDRFLGSLVHHFHPAARVCGQLGLGNQVGCLQNGLERVAEIVGQSAQFAGDFGRNFVCRGHDCSAGSRAAGLTVCGQAVDISVVPLKKGLPIFFQNADMAELADALGSGPSGRKVVEVRVLLSAPKQTNCQARRPLASALNKQERPLPGGHFDQRGA